MSLRTDHSGNVFVILLWDVKLTLVVTDAAQHGVRHLQLDMMRRHVRYFLLVRLETTETNLIPKAQFRLMRTFYPPLKDLFLAVNFTCEYVLTV
jgi:hypothetical protein